MRDCFPDLYKVFLLKIKLTKKYFKFFKNLALDLLRWFGYESPLMRLLSFFPSILGTFIVYAPKEFNFTGREIVPWWLMVDWTNLQVGTESKLQTWHKWYSIRLPISQKHSGIKLRIKKTLINSVQLKISIHF